jgi:hypothetical protein
MTVFIICLHILNSILLNSEFMFHTTVTINSDKFPVGLTLWSLECVLCDVRIEFTNTRTHTQTNKHTHTHTHTYIYIYTHTHIHMHTVCVRVCARASRTMYTHFIVQNYSLHNLLEVMWCAHKERFVTFFSADKCSKCSPLTSYTPDLGGRVSGKHQEGVY